MISLLQIITILLTFYHIKDFFEKISIPGIGEDEDGDGDGDGDGDEDDDDEGEALERMETRAELYGDQSEYINQPNFMRNYVAQLALKGNSTSGNWESLGPTTSNDPYIESGRIRKIIPHPSVNNTIFVLTSGGGLWVSKNFFDQKPVWTPLTDSLYTTSGGSFALGKSPNSIYLGLGDPFSNVGIGGLFCRSLDGGKTFSTPISLSQYQNNKFQLASTVLELVVDTTQASDVVIVSTNAGIFTSTNAGQTFATSFDGTSSYYSSVYSLVLTSLGWLGFDSSNQLLILSTDHGVSWSTLSTSNWNTVTGKISSSAIRTTGAARTSFAVGKAGDAVVYALAAAASSNSNINNHQLDVFKSVDGGITWSALGCNGNKQPTNPKSGMQTTLDIVGVQGWYGQLILVDPKDASRGTVYIGGMASSAKTTNGGSSWSLISTWYNPDSFGLPYVHSDFHAATYMTSSQGVRYVVFGTDGGFSVSPDNGNSWSNSMNLGLSTHLAQYIAGTPQIPSLFTIGLQDLGTRQRKDNTSNWFYWYGGDGEGCGFSQAVNKIGVISIYYNSYRCSNYGSGGYSATYDCSKGIDSADTLFFFTNVATPTAASDPSGTTFFTMTKETIYKTAFSSNAISWKKMGTNGQTTGLSSSGFRGTFHAIGVGLTTTSYVAVAKDKEIAITFNGGVSWKSIVLNTYFSSWSKTTSPLWASRSGTVLYVTSENPTGGVVRMIKSIDSGNSWTIIQVGLPDVPVSKIIADTTDPTGDTVFAATWIGVFYTTDGGLSWHVLGAKLPNVIVNDIYQASGKLQVATYGRGVWQYDLSTFPTTKADSMYIDISFLLSGLSSSTFDSQLKYSMRCAISNTTRINITYVSDLVITDNRRMLLLSSDSTNLRTRDLSIEATSSVKIQAAISAPASAVYKVGGVPAIKFALSNTTKLLNNFRSCALKFASMSLPSIQISSVKVVDDTPTQSPTAPPTLAPSTDSPKKSSGTIDINTIVIIAGVAGGTALLCSVVIWYNIKPKDAVIAPL